MTTARSSATASRPLALITGAARRIGRASALALARAGCDVVITYKGSEREALETVAELIALGANRAVTKATRLDLSDPAKVETAAARLARTLPRLDILIHNASSYDKTPLESLTPDQALDAYRINALAPLLLSKHFAPLLSRSSLIGGGSIVAMCDIHALGEHGLPRSSGFLAYSMSKAALAEMVRTLARELAPKVRVNAVAPGVAAWPDSGHDSDAQTQESYLKRVPLARAGTPEECAEVVRWLALDATYTTGEIIRFDGGRNLI
jgi:pteridine reductase